MKQCPFQQFFPCSEIKCGLYDVNKKQCAILTIAEKK